MPAVFACVTPHPPVLVPEVGKGREREVAATLDAFARLRDELAASKPDVLVFICPHGIVTRDRFHLLRDTLEGNLGRFGAEQVGFRREPDMELIEAVIAEAAARSVPVEPVDHWEPNDHSAWVPLYYLQDAVPGTPVLMLSISFAAAADHYALGRVIAEVAARTKKRIALIASADGAHTLSEEGPYGYHPASVEFEARFHAAFESWDLNEILNFDETFRMQAGEDSIPSVSFLMGALSHHEVQPRILANEGPWGVGYMTALVEIGPERGYGERSPDAQIATPPIVQMARAAVEAFVRDGKEITDAPFADAALRSESGGVFVTILEGDGALRGCIGTTEATQPRLLDEVVGNAIAAASRDPRFDPVREDELENLTYKVDVLGTPEPIETMAELDTERYGVIVEAKGKRGLLLPALDGIDSVRQQVAIAKQKAGIDTNDYVSLQRFQVTRFQEAPSKGAAHPDDAARE
jgi:AmmeMemoRadiSam system protein A